MNRLTDFSMKNIAAVIILILLLSIGGSFAATSLKVESMPDITLPMVFVTTSYKAPPKDVLEQVTKPLEKAIAGTKGLKNLVSSSSDNFSQITVELDQGVKLDDAKKDIESLVANVSLPQSAEKPKVATFGFASQPVYYLAVYGENNMNQTELEKLYKDIILPGFNGISGIDHVDSVGNNEAQISIRLDANALNQYGLSPSDVSDMIKAALMSSPAGTVEFEGRSQMVRVRGQIDTVYNLENTPLRTAKGETLLLKQIAKVASVTESPFIARLNGVAAIGIQLYKTKDANAVEFGNAADVLIAGWEKTLPNIKFLSVYNAATDIKHSIDGMVREGGLGAVLASLMILIFLRNIRMTFIVLVSIPLSILITLLFMSGLDISLNIMTLGGMAIAVGRVVDDSIVVIENIYSQLQKAQERNESVIKMATKQVSAAITSSTITTVGVFAPIAFVSGILGEVFRPFALTLACALLSSLIVALTVIPMLAKLMVMKQKNIPVHDETKVGKLLKTYKSVLVWSLKHRIKTLLLSFLLFVLSLVLIIPQLAMTFMPESEADRQMLFQLQLPRETSMETMNAKVDQIEKLMQSEKDSAGQPKFTYIESLIGYDFGQERVPYKATIFTEVSQNTNAKEALEYYKKLFLSDMPKESRVEGQLLSFGGDGGGGTDFSYLLKGDDLQNLEYAAGLIKEKMTSFPELLDIKDSLGDKKMEVEVLVDAEKARVYGLSPAQVTGAVNSWVRKETLGDIKLDNVTYETKLELDRSFKDSLQDIANIPLRTPIGPTINLKDVAKVREIDAPVAISREKQTQIMQVTAKINNVDKGGVSAKVSAELDKVDLPPGVSRQVKGVSDDINESFGQMFMAMAASIFIVYLVMVLAFGNASAPFAILFSLPLAAIGGLIGLLVTKESLNITSLIGFLMLIGIVVTNAIVLIDRVQQLREQNYSVHDALIEGSMTRMRPIIMTAGATVFALMPLALGLSKGTIISKGLAVVVIGGLTTSTLLTLLVVPVVYDLIHSFKNRISRMFHRKSKKAAAATPDNVSV
ncbi:efflux RND transporter permease subunit [Paenibacillus ginsengarvi]|uniref:Efflux RND transporter permease subunit n=1 Tax=Paenibacillus ginsengarvi TaxID=400777 RepID=A0A3B0AZ46_9BACL|nr:efflux RND transporter permease subunit [Paenibacillus ginsengarvi]RKN65763.1 efflux RND transporter permease subunit [Paenibacillus ginsengarvi]